MLFPLSWENGEVLECAFGSEKKQGDKRYVQLNMHVLDDDGFYIVKNYAFSIHGGVLTPMKLPDGVEEEVRTGSSLPLFQLVRPAIVNTELIDCLIGISVYVTAVDVLQGIYTLYDSYFTEFSLW